MIRNLFYFVYPLNADVWRWNVRRLLDFWGTFNGRKFVMIAVDERTEPADAVTAAFGDSGAAFEVVKNDPARFEAPYFTRVLGDFRSTREDECTLHAHAKGQSHGGAMLENVRRWTDAMYVLNMERPDILDAVLRGHPTAGCFRQVVPHGGASWHFSGGFFWMRHDILFSRDWACTLDDKYAVEGYPGRIFREEESFALTPQWRHEDLYTNAPTEEVYRGWLDTLVERFAPAPAEKGE